MELTILRTYHPGGTNGKLFHYDRFVCHTIELPWLDNKPGLSCIPEGCYRVKLRYSLRHKGHFLLEGVSNRGLILVHPANDAATELKGCIAPVTKLTGQGKGILSRMAFEALKKIILKHMLKEPVFITIKSDNDDNTTKVSGTYAAFL